MALVIIRLFSKTLKCINFFIFSGVRVNQKADVIVLTAFCDAMNVHKTTSGKKYLVIANKKKHFVGEMQKNAFYQIPKI